MSLGEKITALRKSRGMSQEQLGEHLGVSRQAVSKWELNESVPDVDKVVQLSKLFGVTTDYLINDEPASGGGEPIIITTESKKEDKTRTIVSWVATGLGALGILTLMIMSALIEVMVPISRTAEGGMTWYSSQPGYSFFPFIRERHLGFLLFIFIVLVVVGAGILLYDRRQRKKKKQ